MKTTIKTERARKIIRKAEKDLLQARVKSINSILGDNAKQRELRRSKLASLVSTSIIDICQQFIDKVGELRSLKIKERQVNTFNRLLLKKQGNITWFSVVLPTQAGNPQAGNPSQAGNSQAHSTVQAAGASSPQTASSQAGSTISQGDKAVCTQTVSSQVISTISQGDSAVPPGR